MQKFDILVPHYVTCIRGTHIVVTLDIVSEALHVPRVAHPDYPSCNRLRTLSKDELWSLFCETLSSWGNRQGTHCSGFTKGSRFLNMVMTFVLHPLSHYNSITKPRARFLLSLLERLIIDFPFHFILSLIDIYRDTTTRDKLIFPSAITRLLLHFSVSYPESSHFTVMCAIDTTTVKWSEAQLQPKWPRTEIVTSPASFAHSTSTSSSSTGVVTLKAIMAQLQCMGARLDTLNDELCQVNTQVSRIARRQACLGGFVESPSPSPEASEDKDDDGGFDNDDDDEDEDASSSSDNVTTA